MKPNNRPFSLGIAGVCLLASIASAYAQPKPVMTVGHPSGFAISPALRDADDPGTEAGTHEGLRPQPTPGRGIGNGQDNQTDQVAQHRPGPPARAQAGPLFGGVGANGYAPSDANLAVGPNHIVQVVNVRYAVFDKTGTILAGYPKSLGSIWGAALPSCSGNGGDPVVQYDVVANRWLISQLGSTSPPYSECIAVSQTGDPTGAYFLYSFAYGSTLNDYPKFGVWPTPSNSAYLATYNLFYGGSNGAQLCAYDRSRMLSGDPTASYVCFTIPNDYSFLPSDLDGPTPPPNGAPGYFTTFETLSSLRIYTLAPNFSGSSPTGVLTQVTPDLSVASFSEACGGGTCIPQAGTSQTLDSLGDRPMYRTPYRVFGDHTTLLMSHAAAVGGSVGERWYELRSTGGAFSVYQQGTYAPDATYRWMGSIAMDKAGDIGLGYSASSNSINPAVRYTGRVPADSPGTMEAESSIVEGGGSQTGGLSRWGDYSALRIDPSDDCTFWYTNMYEAVSGSFNWSTAIGSFKFAGCGSTATPDFTISANPTALSVTQGGAAGSSAITVTSLNGLADSVALGLTGCPANATCTLTPSSLVLSAGGSATSALSVTPGTATPGTYTLTITGTGNTSGPHSTTVTVTVNASVPDFTISASSGSLTVHRGSSGTMTITVTGAPSSVTLSATGNPTKTSVSFSPNPVAATTGGTSSTMTITAQSKGPKGTYTVTIQGTNGAYTRATQISLTIN